jgi:hypothetical protein
MRLIDDTHAAFTQPFEHLEVGECAADHFRIIS